MKDTLKVPILQPGCHNGGPCLSNCKKKRGGRKEQRKINQNKITFYASKLKRIQIFQDTLEQVSKRQHQVLDSRYRLPIL